MIKFNIETQLSRIFGWLKVSNSFHELPMALFRLILEIGPGIANKNKISARYAT
jgi:hypothetical protein